MAASKCAAAAPALVAGAGPGASWRLTADQAALSAAASYQLAGPDNLLKTPGWDLRASRTAVQTPMARAVCPNVGLSGTYHVNKTTMQ
eukprot:CAMPEP_0198546244 /NCGR_PEP_ID=MMETSP1462-20131121/66718_1 /TAXON_ID=1333877 /ORGANISM="Brandtodinium nutriculum, Strain RCC3387" /LENGTH=87 /DNA_ID=CAMNT_0044276675 /DNA_START=72 /DNA_END=333 /DNA_ORIENTATION=+